MAILRPDVIRTNFPKFSLYPDAWSGQDLRIKVLPDGESGHMWRLWSFRLRLMFVENSLWSYILFVRSSVSAVSYFSRLYISLLAVFLGMPLPYLRNFPVDIYPVNCTFQAWEVLHPLPIHVFQLWVCGINLFVKLRKGREQQRKRRPNWRKMGWRKERRWRRLIACSYCTL